MVLRREKESRKSRKKTEGNGAKEEVEGRKERELREEVERMIAQEKQVRKRATTGRKEEGEC